MEALEGILFQEIIFGVGSFGLVLAFLWLVLRKKTPDSKTEKLSQDPEKPALEASDVPETSPTPSWWTALSKTRSRFSFHSKNLEASQLRDALEEACLVSDLGVQNTEEALNSLDWKEISQQSEEDRESSAKKTLSKLMGSWLKDSGSNKEAWPQKLSNDDPTVLWFVGVNGVGKTTSIAKLASELKSKGHSVLLAAGDTFRAAAGEQLETWAERIGIECIRGAAGADSSAVLFDAIQSAKAKKIDFVLCDSAGRLHNHSQLMDALSKNKRVMSKAMPEAPHETLLVLDAHTGQNMLSQAKQFQESVGLNGLILTKLDGSARGGAVVAVARQTKVPIRRLGLGESEKDFISFDPEAFIDALLGSSEEVKVISQEPVQSL